MLAQERLTRKERRKQQRSGNGEGPNTSLNFVLRSITPLTENQRLTFDEYEQGKHLFLHGCPGSGKSFLSIYLACKNLFENRTFDKIIIVRSSEPSKSVGFLPGNLKEKTKVLEAPYYGIFQELYNRGDAYDYLKNKGLVEFMPTSYIRGITLENCCVIVDECQNLEWNELFAIMTRLGKNSKIIFCGDYKQSDLKNHYQSERREDIQRFRKVIQRMGDFGDVEFGYSDIVRSDIVRKFIIAADQLGYI